MDQVECEYLTTRVTSFTDCNQSGNPPVNGDILAPYHTGSQLVKMPKREFIDRCLATIEVSNEQAEAFYTKLWRLHVDAKYASKSVVGDVISRSSAVSGSTQ